MSETNRALALAIYGLVCALGQIIGVVYAAIAIWHEQTSTAVIWLFVLAILQIEVSSARSALLRIRLRREGVDI